MLAEAASIVPTTTELSVNRGRGFGPERMRCGRTPSESAASVVLGLNHRAEMWDTQADLEAWFETSVKPAFAERGPTPSITFDELNEVMKA